MKKRYDHFQNHLEWEIIEPDQEITNLSFENDLYNLGKDCLIKFSRNNQYKLVASISGIANSPKDLEPNIKRVKGTFVSKEIITGYSRDGLFKFKLYDIVIGSYKSNIISIDDQSIKFQAELIVGRIEKSFENSDRQAEKIQEWYLSGNTDIHFTRSTSRSLDKSYKRLRDGIDREDRFTLVKSSGSSRDHFLIKSSDSSFIIAKVPPEYGPEWSFNLSLEYRQSFGSIPEKEQREAISELVGFVFGNQLLRIGKTTYNGSSDPILQEYRNPWGDNVVSKCQRPGMPPVDISNYHNWGMVEILLNELLPQYFNLRKSLRLKDTLWKYWIARYSSLGTNLPILSSAVETLADQVLKAHPEVKHYYIEYHKFNELISEDIVSIKNKLEDNLNDVTPQEKRDFLVQKILKKIMDASQRGSNEKLKMMFELIELPIGKIEAKAIDARNKMAHSSLGDVSEEEIKDTIRLTRAYETLFHRIILKILGYKGNYIDYYTLGHPNRNIDEPIPE